MKLSILKICIITFFILGLFPGAVFPATSGHRVDISEALSAMMKQVEETYLSHKGITLVNLLDRDPVSAARMLGIGMMSQVEHSKHNNVVRRKYLALVEDIKTFLRQIAHIHQTDPKGVGVITYDQLWNEFKQGFTGKSNDWAVANFGLDPFNVRQPSVLHRAVGPGFQVPEQRATIPMGEPKAGDVRLLDRSAHRADSNRQPSPPPPPPLPSQESKYRWKVLGIYQNPTWWNGSFKAYSPFGNPEKPVVSNITECCDSTRGCPGRNRVKVVPCGAVRGNCVMKVQLLKNSHLGRKGEIQCILLY